MKDFLKYITNIILGLYHLFQGMYITLLNMFRPKVTEQYPENRGKKVYFSDFRGLLTMPHNDDNEHKCTACRICMINCPNGTIKVISSTITDAETGTRKIVLDKYIYDLGSCTFCSLCTSSCPQGAIQWSNAFEHAVFTKEKLEKRLNREGSQLMVKK